MKTHWRNFWQSLRRVMNRWVETHWRNSWQSLRRVMNRWVETHWRNSWQSLKKVMNRWVVNVLHVFWIDQLQPNVIPYWDPGRFKMRISPPYPQRVVKGEWIGRFLRITVKRVAPCWCLDGHVKESYKKCLVCRWQPDRGTTSSVSLHICAVTYITEILLHMM